MEGYVKSTEVAGIGIIEFFHPKGNSLPGYLLDELEEKISSCCKNANVKTIYLRSAGEKTFCAGASFDELLAIENFEQAKKFFSGFAKVILAMKNCDKFVVAKAQGKAVGGGVGLLAAADYVYALESASVRLSEITIGIGPFVIAPAVERKIGASAFAEMTIDAEWKTAKWAYEKGLYNKLFANSVDLEDELKLFLNKLTKYSASAVKEIKAAIWRDTEDWEKLLFERAEKSGKLVLEKEAREFLSEFKTAK